MKRVEKKKVVKNQRQFIGSWLNDELFKDWLRKDLGDTKIAKCVGCHKTIELSSSGQSTLTDHAKGVKHKEALHKVKYFGGKANDKPSSSDSSSSTVNTVATNSQTTLDGCVTKSDVTKAEIVWLLKTVDNGFSVCSINEVFSGMFPDRKIALQFRKAHSKAMYEINHGLAPSFRTTLNDTLKLSDIHVYSFDESLNVTQTSEIDLYLRYWDVNDNHVKVHYYGSSFLGHATHRDLLAHFTDVVKELEQPKLYQVSMDSPNVNLKFYDEFTAKLNEIVNHSLVNIGTCSLHIVHSSFKNGETSTQWGLKKVLKAAYYILHDSPARRDNYNSISGSTVYPLNFCATRWVLDESSKVTMTLQT